MHALEQMKPAEQEMLRRPDQKEGKQNDAKQIANRPRGSTKEVSVLSSVWRCSSRRGGVGLVLRVILLPRCLISMTRATACQKTHKSKNQEERKLNENVYTHTETSRRTRRGRGLPWPSALTPIASARAISTGSICLSPVLAVVAYISAATLYLGGECTLKYSGKGLHRVALFSFQGSLGKRKYRRFARMHACRSPGGAGVSDMRTRIPRVCAGAESAPPTAVGKMAAPSTRFCNRVYIPEVSFWRIGWQRHGVSEIATRGGGGDADRIEMEGEVVITFTRTLIARLCNLPDN